MLPGKERWERRSGTLLLLALLLWTFAGPAEGAMRVFYVATDGNDRWSGTKPSPTYAGTDGPFATLERARDAIRALKAKGALLAGGVTVRILDGLYPRDHTFQLTAEDSGTSNSPIIYSADSSGPVRFVGGKEVTGWKPVIDAAILSQLDEAARGKVMQTDLKAQGITDFGKMSARGFGRPIQPSGLELFFQERPMTLARWPNDGWAHIAAAPDGPNGGKFTYEGDRPQRWAAADDLWTHGYWTWDWADSYEQVKSIDTARHEIATYPPHGVYGYTAGKRYYALNLLEELDSPGEWYLDRKTGILFFWPPAPLEQGHTVVSLLAEPMVTLRDVSYVTLRGLTFECARGAGTVVEGGAHDLIAGCTFRNLGTFAVSIGDGDTSGPDAVRVKSAATGVVGCDIYHTGEGGILLDGGDRMTLTPAGNFAVNNHIYDYQRWARTYRPAIAISGVGNRVAHNLLHDGPHTAILLHGNDHVIEFNEIHHVCMETSDAGAFYMGRDFTERGNIVRYNYFHDLGNLADVQSIYLDDCASGTLVYGNICYKGGRAVQIGGGRDNVVDNNIFVDCAPAVHVDARGLGWAKFWFDGRDPTLMDRLKAVHFDQPPYSVRYPRLAAVLGEEPAVPKGNRVVHNICVGGRWLDLLDGLTDQVVTVQDNLTTGDPKFIAPERGDFRLRPDSPAFKLGFKRLPEEKIGLYWDAYRRTAPSH